MNMASIDRGKRNARENRLIVNLNCNYNCFMVADNVFDRVSKRNARSYLNGARIYMVECEVDSG